MCTLPAAPWFLNPYEVRLKKKGTNGHVSPHSARCGHDFLKDTEMRKKVYLEKVLFFLLSTKILSLPRLGDFFQPPKWTPVEVYAFELSNIYIAGDK